MKKRMTSTPHDAVFKRFLRHPETANDFLTLHLPEAIRQQCDFSTLRLEPASFVDEDLRAWYSDVLWSVQTPCGLGYVYVVIEHQSSPDNHMAFRLMRYTLAAMQRHLDAGHDTLPLVVPILFYHGAVSPWPHTLNWHHLFDHPELASALYGGDFPLVDLTVMPGNQFILHQRMAMLELLQKHIRQRDLAELQPMLIALLAIAEWLEEKGRKKGRREGRLEGRQEGRKEISHSIALKMLASGLDPKMVMELTGLSPEELSSLSR